jgi:hypothetical protein
LDPGPAKAAIQNNATMEMDPDGDAIRKKNKKKYKNLHFFTLL